MVQGLLLLHKAKAGQRASENKVYLLVLALPTEEVDEVDYDAGYHQDLQVVVLPIGSLEKKKQFVLDEDQLFGIGLPREASNNSC